VGINTRKRNKRGRGLFVAYKIVTGLFILAWFGVLGYFVLYPLWPSVQMQLSRLRQFDPYSIGYNATVQLAVKITPPVYEVNGNESEDEGSPIAIIENIDEESAEIARLEDRSVRLEIPSVGADGLIMDGLSQDTMLRGFWHFPLSSEPGRKGNTVIIGHRFHQLPPRTDTFFNLDVVSIGDKIIISSDDADDISYTVVSTDVVGKNDTSVIEDTGDYRITLITCTPVWTSEKRLIIVAVQDKVSRVI